MSNMHDLHRAALDRMLALTVLLHEDATQALASLGLTMSRVPVLWHLRSRGPATQRELADTMGVSARTITGLVDGLVDTGFVTREPHPTDRRANLITFTDLGSSTIDTLEGQQEEFVDLLFHEMPDDRFTCFVDGLNDVLQRLHELGISPNRKDSHD